jgi:hypothetical protein
MQQAEEPRRYGHRATLVYPPQPIPDIFPFDRNFEINVKEPVTIKGLIKKAISTIFPTLLFKKMFKSIINYFIKNISQQFTVFMNKVFATPLNSQRFTISTSISSFIFVFADNPDPSKKTAQDAANAAMAGIIDLHHEVIF